MAGKHFSVSVIIVLIGAIMPFPGSAWDRLEQLPVPASRGIDKSEEEQFNQAVSELVRGNAAFARKVLSPLADSGVIDAQMALGTMLMQSAKFAERKDAIKWLYYAAHDGNWRAQIVVSNTFRDGKYTVVNFDRARQWLQRAGVRAEENLIEEEYHALNAAVMAAAAQAVDRANYQKAQALLSYLAEDGVVEAQEKLAKLYSNGFLGEKVKREAEYWLKKAANNGSKSAQYALALVNLDNPKASPKLKAKSVDLLQQAAAPGPPDAQYRLGQLYLTGVIVSNDKQAGIFWYRLAAEQGHIDAQYSLGVRYVLGEGVAKDDFEAHRWFRRAADQGLAKAMHNLALTYLYGIGTVQQADMAEQWFRSAAKHGIEKSHTFIDHSFSKSTRPQIIKASLNLADKTSTPKTKKNRSKKNKKSLRKNKKSSKNRQKFTTVRGGDWFLNLPNSGYTLQVLSAANKRSIKKFFNKNRINRRKYLHYIDRSGKNDLHVIQYGYFDSLQAAKVSAKKISKNNKLFKPWIRNVKTIKSKIANL